MYDIVYIWLHSRKDTNFKQVLIVVPDKKVTCYEKTLKTCLKMNLIAINHDKKTEWRKFWYKNYSCARFKNGNFCCLTFGDLQSHIAYVKNESFVNFHTKIYTLCHLSMKATQNVYNQKIHLSQVSCITSFLSLSFFTPTWLWECI